MSLIPTVLEPYVIYVKLAIGLAVASAIAIGSYHVGTMSSKTELATYKTDVEAQHAAQIKAVADAYQGQLLAAQAHAITQQGIIDDLIKKLQDVPASDAGLAQRVLDDAAAAACAARSAVPKAGTVAADHAGAAGVPRGDPEAVRLLQGTFDAGLHDAIRLRGAQALAPNPPPQP